MSVNEPGSPEIIRGAVLARYAAIARGSLDNRTSASCCAGPCCEDGAGGDPITRDLYSTDEAANVPETALLASLGCGNPTALAEIRPGEAVLDLGSGGGLDVLLASKRTGPSGHVYGLDMTSEMIALAEQNRQRAEAQNVTFLLGHMEQIPLADSTVDVIISNCVINLSSDKDAVFREALRVLKPGGRLAISDIVWRSEMPADWRHDIELWAGCIAGALLEREYIGKLTTAGFTNISITPTRAYTEAEIRGQSPGTDGSTKMLGGALMSAFVRAEKPLQ